MRTLAKTYIKKRMICLYNKGESIALIAEAFRVKKQIVQQMLGTKKENNKWKQENNKKEALRRARENCKNSPLYTAW